MAGGWFRELLPEQSVVLTGVLVKCLFQAAVVPFVSMTVVFKAVFTQVRRCDAGFEYTCLNLFTPKVLQATST